VRVIDPDGQSTVNLTGVASWALANVNSAPYVFTDDCTNFVSEALHYGGGDPYHLGQPQTDDHYWYGFSCRRIWILAQPFMESSL
jgi:hypothetical protein